MSRFESLETYTPINIETACRCGGYGIVSIDSTTVFCHCSAGIEAQRVATQPQPPLPCVACENAYTDDLDLDDPYYVDVTRDNRCDRCNLTPIEVYSLAHPPEPRTNNYPPSPTAGTVTIHQMPPLATKRSPFIPRRHLEILASRGWKDGLPSPMAKELAQMVEAFKRPVALSPHYVARARANARRMIEMQRRGNDNDMRAGWKEPVIDRIVDKELAVLDARALSAALRQTELERKARLAFLDMAAAIIRFALSDEPLPNTNNTTSGAWYKIEA